MLKGTRPSNTRRNIEVAVVGAGLCGLTIARGLAERSTVLEKSRGVGGRIATRRTETGKLDHGAQFYTLKPTLESHHQEWLANGLVKLWLDGNPHSRFSATDGMTTLAKHLSKNTDVQLHRKVLKLVRTTSSMWQLEIEGSEPLVASKVVLTCPLPQSLEILKCSDIQFDPSLDSIHYAKALVGLFEKVHSTRKSWPPSGYCENPSDNVFSVSDQSRKGLTGETAWTVVMNPKFSAERFDLSDAESLLQIVDDLKKLDPGFTSGVSQLKKWRYSHPLTTYSDLFAEPLPGVYLAGDAFGGPSLNGAVASAHAVLEQILKTEARS